MSQSTTKATFNFTLESECGHSSAGGCDISKDQYSRILAILDEKESQPTDTRSTFSGAADYDQTTPFNGVAGEAE